jgi:hypothetical protein
MHVVTAYEGLDTVALSAVIHVIIISDECAELCTDFAMLGMCGDSSVESTRPLLL